MQSATDKSEIAFICRISARIEFLLGGPINQPTPPYQF